MTVPWLSILIPVYNVKPYLDDCFRSVFAQVSSGVEIIVLDDMSTDGSFQHLEKIAVASPCPVVILRHEKNSGISAARNTLISHAKGEYVWFLDSDDVMREGSIDSLQKIVRLHNPDMVICDYEIWRNDGRIGEINTYVNSFCGLKNQLSTDKEMLFQGLYKCGKFHLWSKIFKRSLWRDDLEFPEGKYFEDLAVVPKLAAKVNSFYYSQCAWIRYRKRSGSILAAFSPQKIEDMLSSVDDVLIFLQQRLPSMSMRSRYFFVRYCVKVYFYAAKESKRMGADFKMNSSENRRRLFHAIGMERKSMVKLYLLNGDFFRLIKILKVLI